MPVVSVDPVHMPLVVVESPYRPVGCRPTSMEWQIQLDNHETYARACMKDCLDRGEAPIASHLLYTQPGVLSETVDAERLRGIEAGLQWSKVAEKTVIYIDEGISKGMAFAYLRAMHDCRTVEFRSLRIKRALALAVAAQEAKRQIQQHIKEPANAAA